MNSKNKKPEIFLFYLLIMLLPFGLRHIFNFNLISQLEGFRENISLSLYAFDIVFILLLFFSSYNHLHKYLRSPKKILRPSKKILKNPLFYFILTLIISAFLSAAKNVAFYNTARLIEVILFFIIAKNLLKSKKIFQLSIWIIFLSGAFQSLLAIFQIILQKSIGLKILGESVIAPNILGVAKIEMFGDKFIRAYGTFPHPNLLGAFLIFSLVCGLWLAKNDKLGTGSKTAPTARDPVINKFVKSIFSLILLGIFLAFSRTAWLAAFLILVFYFLSNQKHRFRSFSRRRKKIILGVFLILIAALSFVAINYYQKNLKTQESFQLRKTYNSVAFKIIKIKPLWGVGAGNFSNVLTALKNSQGQGLPAWHIQPAHNLHLLIASETGLIGFLFFLLFLVFIIRENYFSQKNSFQISNFKFQVLLYAFLFLGLFDHYFWTLPQGQFLFWLVVAFFASFSSINKENNLIKKFNSCGKKISTSKI